MSFTIIAGGRQSLITNESIIHIDAATSVTPKFTNTVTAHPTEGGNNISDHVFRQNTVIDIQGCIVNYPIRDAVDAGPNRVRTQYRQLVRLKENREFISVRSELQTFDQCVITALSFPRTANVGDSLQFSITLEQVQVVEPEAVITSEELLDRLLRPAKVGNKESRDAESEGNSEADKGLFSSIGNFFSENFGETTRVITDAGKTLIGG